VSTAAPASEPGNVARVFGLAIEKPAEAASAPAVADPSTRFALVGVVANRASMGVALLSVDGKPARPYRVGSTIDDGFTLKSVSVRSAAIAEPGNGATFTVNLSVIAGAAGVANAPAPAGAPGRPSRLAPLFSPAPANAASAARPQF
jgi:general secretion pathway protein C